MTGVHDSIPVFLRPKYGFVEDPEEGWSPIECRLELLKISDETYTDAGHAIEWCIRNAH